MAQTRKLDGYRLYRRPNPVKENDNMFPVSKYFVGLLLLLSVTLLLPVAAKAQDKDKTAGSGNILMVTGAVASPGQWTVQSLSKKFAAEIKTVNYTLKGNKGQASCLPLLTVIKAAEPTLNPKVKNHLLSFVALIRASDGYTIAFSMGELQPEVGHGEVWIALDRNGHPVPGDDGPLELLVTSDKKPSRWVHGITRILLIDGIDIANKAVGTP